MAIGPEQFEKEKSSVTMTYVQKTTMPMGVVYSRENSIEDAVNRVKNYENLPNDSSEGSTFDKKNHKYYYDYDSSSLLMPNEA